MTKGYKQGHKPQTISRPFLSLSSFSLPFLPPFSFVLLPVFLLLLHKNQLEVLEITVMFPSEVQPPKEIEFGVLQMFYKPSFECGKLGQNLADK